MSKSWKAAESRIGAWFGAKGIKKSGRVPLSGGNSGQTRGDAPHPTIYIETKRAKAYHSAITLWREYFEPYRKQKEKPVLAVALPVVHDRKVIEKTSDIWCIYSEQFERATVEDVVVMPWKGPYPSTLTLYEEAQATKQGALDRDKELAVCALVYHGHPGFWIVINKYEIKRCWELIGEARIQREKLIEEEADED